jgi:hypothetical protein
VVELARLGHRELENLLGSGGIGKLAQRDRRLPLLDGFFDPLVHLIEIRAQVGEHGRGDTFTFRTRSVKL